MSYLCLRLLGIVGQYVRKVPRAQRPGRSVNASLSDLLKAYARVKTRDDYEPLNYDKSEVYSVEAALERLKALLGNMPEGVTLASYLPEGWNLEPAKRRSAMASSFSAMLGLAKRGDVEIRQDRVFAPIYLRQRGAERAGA